MNDIVNQLRSCLSKADNVEIEVLLGDSEITNVIDGDIFSEPTAGGGCTYDTDVSIAHIINLEVQEGLAHE